MSNEDRQWPEGQARPAGGWNPYRDPDLLADLGLAKPGSEQVILRAILATDQRVGGHGLEMGIVDTRRATTHEVVAVAPDVPEEWGLAPGVEVIHLSAAADFLDSSEEGRGRYSMVFYKDIGAYWDGARARQVLELSASCETLDDLRRAMDV